MFGNQLRVPGVRLIIANIKDRNVIENSNDNPEMEFRKKRWYHRRDVRFVGLVIAFVLFFQSYGFVTGPSRISDKLSGAMASGQEKIDILIWAKFPAEAFHMELYQTLGAIRGELDGAVRLGRVKPQDIKFLYEQLLFSLKPYLIHLTKQYNLLKVEHIFHYAL